jgi:hypothetical protein
MLNCLKAALSILNTSKSECVLGYGTLLGARRDASFIPHDDDTDIIICDDSRSREEAKENAGGWLADLEKAGFLVSLEPGLFHYKATLGKGSCDVFMTWSEDNKLFLPMEGYRIRPISKSILFPRRNNTIKLYDSFFPAPFDVESFLSERYGSTWMIPNKFHEWPWPLQDE